MIHAYTSIYKLFVSPTFWTSQHPVPENVPRGGVIPWRWLFNGDLNADEEIYERSLRETS